jgi:predicted transcriptional regulator
MRYKTETLTTSQIQKQKKAIQALAANNYGSRSTIGARQTAILADILLANVQGASCTIAKLLENHPVTHQMLKRTMVCLQARGLVRTRKVRGRPYELTASGFAIAMKVRMSNIAPGLGVVAVNVRNKKK